MPTRVKPLFSGRFSVGWCGIALCLFTCHWPAIAQSDNGAPVDLNPKEIQARIESLPADDPAGPTYRLALEALTRASAARDRAAEFAKRGVGVPERLSAIREQIDAPTEPVQIDAAADTPVTELQTGQAEAAAALQAAKDRASELAAEAQRRDVRRKQIPELLAAARQRLAAVRAELPADAPVDLSNASAVLTRAQSVEINAEIAAMEAEIASYEARRDLLPAQRDLAARRVTELEQRMGTWRAAVQAAREREAQRAAAEADRLRKQVASQAPVLRDYAAENAALAQQLDPGAKIPAETRAAQGRLTGVEDKLEEIDRNYTALRRRLNAASMNRATGRMLRSQYRALDDPDVFLLEQKSTQRQLEDAEYTLIERREARDALRGIDEPVARLLNASATVDDDQRVAIESVARELVTARRDLLSALVDDSSRHVQVLFALQQAQTRLRQASRTFRTFLQERILWVPSLPANRHPRLSDLRETYDWLARPDARQQTQAVCTQWLAERPGQALAMFVLVIAAFAGSWIGVRRQSQITQRVRRPSSDTIGLTIRSLGWTVVSALPTALLVYSIGWWLAQPPEQTVLGISLSKSFAGAGVVWFAFALLRSITMKDGLADAHFRWPAAGTSRIRTDATWAGLVLSVGMAVMALTDSSGLEAASATIGRLGFTAAALAAAAFVFRVLHPRGPVISAYLASTHGQWLNRIRLLWFWPLVGSPIVFVGLVWFGYVYTAYQLSWLLGLTFGLIFAVVLLNAMLRRWLLIAQRRAALEEARRRRAEAAQQAANEPATELASESGISVEQDRIDLQEISAQALQLIRVGSVVAVLFGLLVIWGDFLPALRMLNRVELYPQFRLVADDQPGQGVAPTGHPPGCQPPNPAPRSRPIQSPAQSQPCPWPCRQASNPSPRRNPPSRQPVKPSPSGTLCRH